MGFSRRPLLPRTGGGHRPSAGEVPALPGPVLVHGTTSALEELAGTVGIFPEAQSGPVAGQHGEPLDPFGLRLAESGRKSGDIFRCQPDMAGPAATIPAPEAREAPPVSGGIPFLPGVVGLRAHRLNNDRPP